MSINLMVMSPLGQVQRTLQYIDARNGIRLKSPVEHLCGLTLLLKENEKTRFEYICMHIHIYVRLYKGVRVVQLVECMALTCRVISSKPSCGTCGKKPSASF